MPQHPPPRGLFRLGRWYVRGAGSGVEWTHSRLSRRVTYLLRRRSVPHEPDPEDHQPRAASGVHPEPALGEPLPGPGLGGRQGEWRAENLGWFDSDGELVGAGLVLYRQLPKVKRYLAYLPEGPVINWYAPNLEDWLRPMLAHLKQQGAFSVKMGPPVVIRRWDAPSIKRGIQDPDVKRLRDVEATHIEPRAFEVADRLRRMGWQQGEDGGAGFGDVQPRYVFQVPLDGRSLEDVHKGFNQLWRRNIKKAEKAGVQVVQGGYEDLDDWQRLYEITAERDKFRPRPLGVLPAHVEGPQLRGPQPHAAVLRRARGRADRGGDDADRRRPCLVLLRRLRQPQA